MLDGIVVIALLLENVLRCWVLVFSRLVARNHLHRRRTVLLVRVLDLLVVSSSHGHKGHARLDVRRVHHLTHLVSLRSDCSTLLVTSHGRRFFELLSTHRGCAALVDLQ